MRALLLVLLLPLAAFAGNITPVLITDGNNSTACDGQWRWMYTVGIQNKVIVGGYLQANLVTNASSGADIVIWSPAYGAAANAINSAPSQKTGFPMGQFGALVDLHDFPVVVGGGRIGKAERMFPGGDGVYIQNSIVQIGAQCDGGGHIEIYGLIFVRDP